MVGAPERVVVVPGKGRVEVDGRLDRITGGGMIMVVMVVVVVPVVVMMVVVVRGRGRVIVVVTEEMSLRSSPVVALVYCANTGSYIRRRGRPSSSGTIHAYGLRGCGDIPFKC